MGPSVIKKLLEVRVPVCQRLGAPCSPHPRTQTRTFLSSLRLRQMCAAGDRAAPLLPSPSGAVPSLSGSDVCASNCRSWVPSLTLGDCFPGLWESVCLHVGVSVCLAVCVSSLTQSI